MNAQDVIIRHSDQSDAAAIKSIYACPENYAGTLQLPYPSLDKWQRAFSQPNDHFYSLVAEYQGQLIGQIGMDVFTNPRRKHVANIGMAVLPDYQNKGIGKQLLAAMSDLAFNWLAIRRIELEVYTDNARAIALYEKAGFVIEGTARGYAFRDGEYTDVYLMAKCI